MNYTKPVCRGSWALGSACGKCERCEETRPHEAKVSAQPQLRDSLAQVQDARYVVLKASGSRFAYVQDTHEGRTVKRYDILKGEGKRNGWNMAKAHADALNANQHGPELMKMLEERDG